MVRTRRTGMLFIRWALAGCLMLVLATPRGADAQSRFSGIVVFGTSLSDPGNAFALRGEALTPPDYALDPLLVPSAPYARGGHHFSNGATWIEQYAASVGLAASVRPAFAKASASVTNYAVGGARSYQDNVNINLSQQVAAYLQRAGGVADPQALYVIEMGGNDIRNALAAAGIGGNPALILGAAINAIVGNIYALHRAGAREFLVWSAPNVALTPAIRSLGPAAIGGATLLTQGFNAGLTQGLTMVQPLPGIKIMRLDAYELLRAIVETPSAFGLTTVATACVSATADAPPFACSDVDQYLFWDGIHPTRAGHAIIAEEAAKVLQ